MEASESPPINRSEPIVPKITGIKTPAIATPVAAAPLRLSSLISVSRPLENKMKITPSCEKLCSTSISVAVGLMIPPNPRPRRLMMAGPISNPAKIIPTTCGSPSFLVTIPNVLVASRMTAQSNTMFITSKPIVYITFL